MGERRISIAIDGPASSGKGTVARRVAAELGYGYVDTGALYRGVGLSVLREGADPTSEAACAPIAAAARFQFSWAAGRLQVCLNGEDVTAAIRTEPVSAAASAVAVHPGVRAALLQTQRALGEGGGVVMDGRDVGTVVMPGAELKVFLDASLEERARRRQNEIPGSDLAQIRGDLAARDAQDSGRAAAPLRAADDAVALDSTGRTIDEVVQQVIALALARGA
jgi:cytidylate kinase